MSHENKTVYLAVDPTAAGDPMRVVLASVYNNSPLIQVVGLEVRMDVANVDEVARHIAAHVVAVRKVSGLAKSAVVVMIESNMGLTVNAIEEALSDFMLHGVRVVRMPVTHSITSRFGHMLQGPGIAFHDEVPLVLRARFDHEVVRFWERSWKDSLVLGPVALAALAAANASEQ